MQPNTLDHVAFWLADREPIAEFVTTRLGLHVIDRQDNFTLVGARSLPTATPSSTSAKE